MVVETVVPLSLPIRGGVIRQLRNMQSYRRLAAVDVLFKRVVTITLRDVETRKVPISDEFLSWCESERFLPAVHRVICQ